MNWTEDNAKTAHILKTEEFWGSKFEKQKTIG